MNSRSAPTVIKTPEAADFLALVPRLAGFHPRNSVVLVAFRGNRTHGAMRFDLPTGETDTARKRLATSFVGMLSKMSGIDGVVPVIYTDDPFGRSIPHEAFARAVIKRARLSGFRVSDALCVAADGWASYFDDDYPHGGDSLDEIASSPVASRHDAPQLGQVADAATLPEVAFERRERVGRLIAMRDADPVLRASLAFVIAVGDLPLDMEELLACDPGELAEEEIAIHIATLQTPSIRDAVMLLWAFDLETGDRVFDMQERYADGEDIRDDPDAGLMMGEGPRPDPERINRALVLLKLLVAHSPRSCRPPLLCMLAWLSWALGRGTVAGIFVQHAVEIDPAYSMAGLLGTMAGNGMLPEWAFDDAGGDERYDATSTNLPST